MAVYLPCYSTREDVKTAVDIKSTVADNVHVDSAIQGAVGDIIGLCHRRFHNVDETHYFDWPSYQYAYPWRIWLDAYELADVTVNVPVVTSGGVVIPNANIFWGDPNDPVAPYGEIQLDRSSTSTFGVGSTPQRDVAITGTYGYWTQSRPAGALAAAITTTTQTFVTTTDGAAVGVGDTLTVDSERLLVSERSFVDSGQTQVSGCTTAKTNDNVLGVATGSDFFVGEVVQLDAESMLITSITGNSLTVERSYDGSVLATHSAGVAVYVNRGLTVLRGQFGTTAATHLNATAMTALLVPSQVRELAIAYSLVYMAQKSAGYARALAEQTTAVPGQGLAVLEGRVVAAYGRKARLRVI